MRNLFTLIVVLCAISLCMQGDLLFAALLILCLRLMRRKPARR